MPRKSTKGRSGGSISSHWLNSALSIVCAVPILVLCAAGAMWASFRICHYLGLFGQNLRLFVAAGVFSASLGLWCWRWCRFSRHEAAGVLLVFAGAILALAAVIVHLA